MTKKVKHTSPTSSYNCGNSAEKAVRHRGLPNLGNTCYMNASLQMLLAVFGSMITLEERLCETEGSTASNSDGTVTTPLLRELTTLFDLLVVDPSQASDRAIQACLENVKYIAANRNRVFEGSDQCDAHEFLRTLLDVLHDETNRGLGSRMGYKEMQPKEKSETQEKAAARWLILHTLRDRSPVTELWYGQQMTLVTCTGCKAKTASYDLFSSIHVDTALPDCGDPEDSRRNGNGDTRRGGKKEAARPSTSSRTGARDLEVALRSAVDGSVVTVENYACETCGKKCSVDVKTSLLTLPRILLVHLKRFSADGTTKIHTPVTIPQSTMVLRDKEYVLRSVVYHIGDSMSGGHYVATVDGVLYDDDEVRSARAEECEGDAVLVLFTADDLISSL